MPLAIFILIAAILLAIYFSRQKSAKMKFRIWGITSIIFIAPLVSWIAGILFGMSVGDGFAGMTIMVYGFVFLEVIGFILLYFGIFKRERPNF